MHPRTKDGYFWIVGRIDDVWNVAGHRIAPGGEALSSAHPKVAEAPRGRPADELKGQALVAFVTLRVAFSARPALREDCAGTSPKRSGPSPSQMIFV